MDEVVEANNDDPCCEECVAWRTGEPIQMRSSATGFTVKVLPEFVDAYLDAGWEAVESETKGCAMTEREELIQIIWDGAVADRVKDGKDLSTVPVIRPKVEAMADEVLGAGFVKQRTVTTTKELDALGNGALIRTRHGEYREAAKLVGGENIWRSMGPRKVVRSAELAAWHLPATVLHEGEAE